jgi:PDZ domain-containing protein
MDQSKLDAASVVLSRVAGYPTSHGSGVLVEFVYGGCPAQGRLFVGDRILTVDGSRVPSERAFEQLLDRIPNEEPVRLTGRAGGKGFSATVTRRPCSNSGRPLLGITTIASFPFRISISSDDIGGPSAGLMWALGLYDLLTPGDLTGGRVIAGTGTIDLDGTVGAIGGVQTKIAAAKASGAKVFLVPQGNLAEARPAANGITLVPVSTLRAALDYLRTRSTASG